MRVTILNTPATCPACKRRTRQGLFGFEVRLIGRSDFVCPFSEVCPDCLAKVSIDITTTMLNVEFVITSVTQVVAAEYVQPTPTQLAAAIEAANAAPLSRSGQPDDHGIPDLVKLSTVVDLVNSTLGLHAWLEHPGVVMVTRVDHANQVFFGIVNEFFAGDIVSPMGDDLGHYNSDIPSKPIDVEKFAAFIKKAMTGGVPITQ